MEVEEEVDESQSTDDERNLNEEIATITHHTANNVTDTDTKPKKSEDRCNAIKFSDFSKLLEQMTKERGSIAKLKLLFNAEFKKYINGESIFPLLRLILPANDTERGKYGLKQATIAKLYVTALHLDKESEDAKRLLNWKDPTKAQGVELSKLVSGDFGMILEEVLKSRVTSDTSKFTIGEINKILDELANALSVEEKLNIIRIKVLDSMNATEQKWLVRIIFQDLKVGLKHENVLGGFYPSALKRYNECTNLRTICEEEGTIVEVSGIQLFIHFSPMLSKGFPNSSLGQIGAVEHSMNAQPFVMDLKLDGERILAHIGDDNSYILYTRRGNDYTENYWPIAHDIIASIRKRCKISCIIDGEILAINGNTKAHLPFGHNLTIARNEREYGENKQQQVGWHTALSEWMMFYVFDIVYIAGEDSQWIISSAMTDCGLSSSSSSSSTSSSSDVSSAIASGEISHLPLLLRRKILEKIFEPSIDRVEMIPYRYCISSEIMVRKQQLEEYFNEVTLDGKEGVVIKNLNSPYELGEKSRSFAYWVKMKPEYGEYQTDLDLLILGGYYGEGQSMRGQGISTFLCGIKDNNNPNIYQTLCKVGTGYSFEQLTELREKLKEIENPWNHRHPPDHLAHWKIAKSDDRPHVYYPPEQSIVIQLKCAEIVESTAFSCNLTCRFPRVQRIRYDKMFYEILSVDDIIELKNRPRKTTADGEGQEGGEGELNPDGTRKKGRKKGATTGRKKEIKADPQFRIDNNKEAIVVSDGQLFKDESYCVLENDFQLIDYQTNLPTKSFTRDQVRCSSFEIFLICLTFVAFLAY
jgi:DNA ligase-4